MRQSISKAFGRVKLHDENILIRSAGVPSRHASGQSATSQTRSPAVQQVHDDLESSDKKTSKETEKKKSVEEQDADLRSKLEGISGGGGEAGLELENGQPVAMKRSVKENMFRLI